MRLTATTTTSLLEKLPNELKYMIQGNLDRVSSACLGVTRKNYYALHRRMHGTVELSETPTDNYIGYFAEEIYAKSGTKLANRLLKWIPRELKYYNYKDGIFVTKERFRGLRKE